MNFNHSQLKAIRHGAGPMLVIAGPGSGKTTVLTNRIQYLIQEHKVTPQEILVITFTKAAATEMKLRFGNMMKTKTPVTFGTFHGIYFSILRAAYHYSADSIIKEDRRQMILRHGIEKSHVEPEDEKEFLENIAAEISKVKTEGLDIHSYYAANCGESAFREIYLYYTEALKKARLIDFDDMLLYCYELLSQRPDVLKAWQARYRYILIDEFQDINKIQYDVIKMLALPENNLFIVGDDDQSIYGFRGSRPEIMLSFQEEFPDAQKVLLDQNYRSAGNIVEAAGRVIGHNKIRFAKEIATDNPRGASVEIGEFHTMTEEYARIIQEVRQNVSKGKSYKEHAILYRTNGVAAPLVRRLIENNIPFVIKDGIPNLFEHWIAKDFQTYMIIAMGSRKRSDFIQIMNKPKRYIGRDYLNDAEISFSQLAQCYEDKNWMADRIRKMEMDLKQMSNMSPFAMINYLRMGVGYDAYIQEYAVSHGIQVQELLDVAAEVMDSARNFQSFDQWFAFIAEYTKELKENTGNQKESEQGVTLTTMHSSKGLEYDWVYIIDANETITPHKKAVFEADIEEERRMFYVAMTRARQQLNIFYTKERYNKKMEPSRFLNEIMQEKGDVS